MRTTLTIDDDVLAAVKERARSEGRTAGEILSELARRALSDGGRPPPAERNGFPVLTSSRNLVTDATVETLRAGERV